MASDYDADRGFRAFSEYVSALRVLGDKRPIETAALRCRELGVSMCKVRDYIARATDVEQALLIAKAERTRLAALQALGE